MNLAEARTSGAVRYQGKPCPHGHPGVRYTYNSGCVDCTLAKNRTNHSRKIANRERWRVNNQHRMKEIRARQYRLNPESRKLRAAKRRAIKAEGNYTKADINDLFDKQIGICAALHCNASLNFTYHIDHVLPLIRGGSNWPSNLQLLCPKCNGSKGSKTMEEWIAWLSQ